jgi:hypothetical protein
MLDEHLVKILLWRKLYCGTLEAVLSRKVRVLGLGPAHCGKCAVCNFIASSSRLCSRPPPGLLVGDDYDINWWKGAVHDVDWFLALKGLTDKAVFFTDLPGGVWAVRMRIPSDGARLVPSIGQSWGDGRKRFSCIVSAPLWSCRGW